MSHMRGLSASIIAKQNIRYLHNQLREKVVLCLVIQNDPGNALIYVSVRLDVRGNANWLVIKDQNVGKETKIKAVKNVCLNYL